MLFLNSCYSNCYSFFFSTVFGKSWRISQQLPHAKYRLCPSAPRRLPPPPLLPRVRRNTATKIDDFNIYIYISIYIYIEFLHFHLKALTLPVGFVEFYGYSMNGLTYRLITWKRATTVAIDERTPREIETTTKKKKHQVKLVPSRSSRNNRVTE